MNLLIEILVAVVIGAGLVKMWRDGRKKDAITILIMFSFLGALIVFMAYMTRSNG